MNVNGSWTLVSHGICFCSILFGGKRPLCQGSFLCDSECVFVRVSEGEE